MLRLLLLHITVTRCRRWSQQRGRIRLPIQGLSWLLAAVGILVAAAAVLKYTDGVDLRCDGTTA